MLNKDEKIFQGPDAILSDNAIQITAIERQKAIQRGRSQRFAITVFGVLGGLAILGLTAASIVESIFRSRYGR